MTKQMIAKKMLVLAKELLAADPIMEQVLDIVKTTGIMSLRRSLSRLREVKKVEYGQTNYGMYCSIQLRNGKKIGVASKKVADMEFKWDHNVGNMVVGYM